MTSLGPGRPPTELRIIPSITRQCLTWGSVGPAGIALSSSTCTGGELHRWALSKSGMLRLGNATSTHCLAAKLADLGPRRF